jgi:hypothetical protein
MDDPKQNPIVQLASRLRARRDLGAEIDAAVERPAGERPSGDAEQELRKFGEGLQQGAKRLNSILGKNGVTFVRLENPLRLRLRFREHRVSLDLDAARQLVSIAGLDLAGEYQFLADSPVPALINLSKISTEAGYGDPLTANALLKTIAQDAELPRPEHLDGSGPLQF